MDMLRITGLLGAALLTMGSGGVAQAPDDSAPTAIEPEYVDQQTGAGPPRLDAGPAITEAAGNGTSAAAPAAPSEMAASSEEGATLEIELSDDYIQGRYYTGGGILGFDNTVGHVGAYFSDGRDLIGNVGVMTEPVPLFIPGLTLSAGGRGYLALLSDPNDDVVGVGPGVQGRFALPNEIGFPLAAVGSFFYTPDILTLGDAQDIVDLDLRVEAEVIPDIVGFVGYREFRFDSDEGDDVEAASEFMLGARFNL